MNGERDERDYLWDGSGEPDPGVARLERQLRPLRGEPAPLDLATVRRFRPRPRWPRVVARLAVAASLIAAASFVLLRLEPGSWRVTRLAGVPRVGGEPVETTGRLRVGGWLETDGASRAKVLVGSIGQVDLEPSTRVRLLKTGRDEKRIELERGTIRALISAPPRLFQVATRGAVAVDLGCAYTLTVDGSGRGMLRVEFGWVSLEDDGPGRESYVPAGAACRVGPDGPGTPFFQDASRAFQEALVAVDAGGPGRGPALERLIAEARGRDALSLLALLSRSEGEERGRLYHGLARLSPPPPGVTREAVLGGSRGAIDVWWRALGLGEIKWWRVGRR